MIRGVPDYIADLMAQIDCFNPAIFEAGHTFSDAGLPSTLWNDSAAKHSTAYCRNALRTLTSLVDDLSPHISSARRLGRKLATIKVVLKRDLLKKLEKRPENAVNMLIPAQQGYLM